MVKAVLVENKFGHKQTPGPNGSVTEWVKVLCEHSVKFICLKNTMIFCCISRIVEYYIVSVLCWTKLRVYSKSKIICLFIQNATLNLNASMTDCVWWSICWQVYITLSQTQVSYILLDIIFGFLGCRVFAIHVSQPQKKTKIRLSVGNNKTMNCACLCVEVSWLVFSAFLKAGQS